MIQTRTLIRRTRSVRDLYRGKRYAVVAVFPGGREIVKARVETRPRAFRAALLAARPQTSPTAATTGGYTGPGVAPGTISPWNPDPSGGGGGIGQLPGN